MFFFQSSRYKQPHFHRRPAKTASQAPLVTPSQWAAQRAQAMERLHASPAQWAAARQRALVSWSHVDMARASYCLTGMHSSDLKQVQDGTGTSIVLLPVAFSTLYLLCIRPYRTAYNYCTILQNLQIINFKNVL